ncbi:MAG: Rrf2 family transcriptional regulator [Mogibacterium diversum]|uniref:Rrf2 family transcriptional regulator n=1 Tax=Mogibacterium diversum TaxID=114527 RepID=A0A2S0L221_9FIRM|nr:MULTISPECIES: Rrf2 family transcriptional regulator [Mogibacterium]AVM47338.1 Rrf2 family transcriptional regulator [Mogibacterium diversum]MBB1532639.1 Rrf2 family transcriptional regulator [Mogibacterium sp.]MBF1319994.1 Rrf2 family transcriptional regulator [Mogibacterium diversum]MBF1322733.1 Rrf2 family transcriptional regulator [Mogibacterium diversum]MBF1328824.1 Rrf2 family transcriptional regulator [Mogibacterium diversum]
MLVSTRGRYAIRVMIDLAEHMNGKYIPMKEIADRQDVSLKYMTKIMQALTKSGMLDGQHGKGGGYKLNRDPEEYRVGDILRLTEGTLAPVACIDETDCKCDRSFECRTRPMWNELDKLISEYLDGITIADLMEGNTADNYVI